MGSTAASPDHLNCCNEGEAGVNTPGGHEAPHPTQTRTAFKALPCQTPLAQCPRVHLAQRHLLASSTTRIPLLAHTGSPKPTRKLLLYRRFPGLSELWKWGKFSKQKNLLNQLRQTPELQRGQQDRQGTHTLTAQEPLVLSFLSGKFQTFLESRVLGDSEK